MPEQQGSTPTGRTDGDPELRVEPPRPFAPPAGPARPGGGRDLRRPAVVVGILAGLALLTRLPGLVLGRVYNVDETYLTAMGQAMARGGRLYTDVVDRKPPLLPWIYAMSSHLTGGTIDLRVVRLLAALAVAGTAVLIHVLVRRLGGSRDAALTAGALYVLATMAFPPADGLAANFELFAVLPATGAVVLAVSARGTVGRARLLRFLGAGALLALATMVKQPFLAILAPVALEAWRDRPRRWAGLAAITVGLAATSLAVAAPFGVGDVLRWAWLDTGDYLDGKVGALRAVGVLALVVLGLLVLHLPTVSALWSGRRKLRRLDPVLWWWFGGAAIGVVPGFHFLVHYLQLVAPPLAAAVGLVLADAPARARTRVLIGSAAVAAACTVVAVLPISDQTRVDSRLVAAVRTQTQPGQRILVWGAMPELYWRADRMPAAPFLSVGYLTGKWADRDGFGGSPEDVAPFSRRWAIFRRDLLAHPPQVIVDMTHTGLDEWGAYPVSRYRFGRVLDACYTPLPPVDGMAMWKLTDPSCLATLLDPAHAAGTTGVGSPNGTPQNGAPQNGASQSGTSQGAGPQA